MTTDGPARRIHPTATWKDLALPAEQVRALRQIGDAARERGQAAAATAQGPRVSALFVGAGGSVRAMAAEALAKDLGLDLLRLDLGRVVSRSIGETGKNLARAFDAAAKSGAVLFLDEADALFGKRTDVKDAHDRHANLETGNLLQGIEARDGLTILGAGLRAHLDPALVRGMRFVVELQPPGRERTPPPSPA